MSFAQLFQDSGRLIVPLFQRSYCWGMSETIKYTKEDGGQQINLAESWWQDVKKASADATHRVGKIILYRDRNTDEAAKQMLLVDGQQRVTTTSILLMTIRDAALRYGTEANELINEIHGYLFNNVDEGNDWI